MVDTEGKFVQALAIAAEVMFEYGQLEGSKVLHRVGPKLSQLLSGNFPDTWQASNWQRQQKRVNVLRLDDKQPIGLSPVGGKLG